MIHLFQKKKICNDNKEINGDLVQDEIADVNIFQTLTQEGTLRQVGDGLAAIKFECIERGQQLLQDAYAISTRSTTTMNSFHHSYLSVVVVDDGSIS